jgi:transcriptional regulator with XRE-family HTH domain
LGQSIGLSAVRLTRYETAQAYPRARQLAAIAKALTVPLSYFFEDFEISVENQIAESHRGGGALTLLSTFSKLDLEKQILLILIAKSLSEMPQDPEGTGE